MTEQGIELVQILVKAYVDLNRLHAQPGDKCHMLASSIKAIERLLREVVLPPRIVVKGVNK